MKKVTIGLIMLSANAFSCDVGAISRTWSMVDEILEAQVDISNIMSQAREIRKVCRPFEREKDCLKRKVLGDDFKLAELSYLVMACQANENLFKEL